MSNTPKILAFGGSLRKASFNHKAAVLAAEGARAAGADVTLIALSDHPLPIFNEDIEASEGVPENALTLKKLFLAHDGLIIASPEYNSTISAALKNAFDWVSRQTSENEAMLAAFTNKTAAILAASPGGYGGARGLKQLRPFLENINIRVIEPQVTIAKAHEVIREDGSFADESIANSVRNLGADLVRNMRGE